MAARRFPISAAWVQGAGITYLVGFTILGILAYLTYAEQPPIPARVTDPAGQVLYTREDVLDGMNVFQRHGLMEYGTVYGHGAYLGPDFTAEWLHREALSLRASFAATPVEARSAAERTVAELHRNAYDPAQQSLVYGAERAAAFRELTAFTQARFAAGVTRAGLQARAVAAPEDTRRLAAFFAWTSWTAAADRPGRGYSYTANWPPEPLAGNTLTPDALVWSAVSIIALLGGAGVVFWFFGRFDWLGWAKEQRPVRFRAPGEVALAPAQRAIVWFLLVASALFLVQTLLGGLIAHYRAEPAGFYGFDASRWLPYNAARTWHLQLALFWVSTSFLATGIFLAPIIAGREPRGQGTLTLTLFGALVLVVVGSLAGEYLSIRGALPGAWWWIGHQGWEYLDLGRVWQVLLVIGLFLWVYIVWRGLRGRLRTSPLGNMPWLLFFAALAIPVFYAVGLLAGRRSGFVVTDFWRFWVVHLWVEDFLELFTTVVVAYVFVLLGTVREETALRVIYLDVILYSVGGVVGTMHHVYFSGTPSAHLALGATFSAMEVIPLLLLSLEAWGFLRSGERTVGDFPHRWAVRFLVAVGVWNFLGAGVFGFLINLPVVSYFEIGTNLTANHGHGAMMGVYGMLAIGLLLFCLRYLTAEAAWSDRSARLCFWSLNAGLAWMLFGNLFPVGVTQLWDALAHGYWHARSEEFLGQGWVRALEWLRLPGDALFILGGAVPLVGMCLRAVRHPAPRRLAADAPVPEQLFTAVGPEARAP